MVNITNNYAINAEQLNLNIDELITTKLPPEFGGAAIDDFSCKVKNGTVCNPYLTIIPFGPSEDLSNKHFEDADILIYMLPHMDLNNTKTLLKQRGWHTDICYKDNNDIHIIGAYYGKLRYYTIGNMPKYFTRSDGTLDKECPNIFHIYRLTTRCHNLHFMMLKSCVRYWKDLFCNYTFAEDNANCKGITQLFDPADFHDTKTLECLARAIINHPPDQKPAVPPILCVQWVYQILCLSLMIPINETTLRRLCVWDEFNNYWAKSIPLQDSSLVGLPDLPMTPYSPAQVIQAFLNTYDNGANLISELKIPKGMSSYLTNIPKQVDPSNKMITDCVDHYFSDVEHSNNIAMPFNGPNGENNGFVLPIMFYCESHNKLTTKEDYFWEYIGTGIHRDFIKGP